MKKRAFTLIELIIVIGIIAILYSIANLRFTLVDQTGFEEEVQTFVNDYNYSRQKAMARKVPNWINFDSKSSYESNDGDIKRKLKHSEFMVDKYSINFMENGNIKLEKNQSYDLIFYSKKNPEKFRRFTIGAIGGYLSEKD